jgi:DNA processing protein
MNIFEKIEKINIKSDSYPKPLKTIKNPPKILYFIGKLVKNESCLAIVGTRRCTNYGKEVAYDFSSKLSESGLTIVSGLAPGIDTAAHKAVVEEKKRTIAVLGSGLDAKNFYPKINLKLAEEIIKNDGLIISEYPPGMPGSKITFPARNRIIAGLSLGILVVEAPIKSGALITANYGFSEKRKIFAVPGSIYSQTSKGCHYLIKKGAKLVENTNDILKELNLPSFETPFSKNEVQGDSLEENLILNSLKGGVLNIDELIKKTALSPQKVASTLTVLEMKNKIKNLGGNNFSLQRKYKI